MGVASEDVGHEIAGRQAGHEKAVRLVEPQRLFAQQPQAQGRRDEQQTRQRDDLKLAYGELMAPGPAGEPDAANRGHARKRLRRCQRDRPLCQAFDSHRNA